MKYRLLFVVLFVTSLSFSQKSNQVKVYYGFADSDYIPEKEVVGGAISTNAFIIHELGIEYNRKIAKHLRIETGLNYFSSKVPYDIHFCPPQLGVGKDKNGEEKVQLLTIPISLITEFWKYFYLNTGFLVDFQLNNTRRLDSQSGLGFLVGIGGKYDYKDFTFFVTPEFRRHRLLGFKEIRYPEFLAHLGLKIGVGYSF